MPACLHLPSRAHLRLWLEWSAFVCSIICVCVCVCGGWWGYAADISLLLCLMLHDSCGSDCQLFKAILFTTHKRTHAPTSAPIKPRSTYINRWKPRQWGWTARRTALHSWPTLLQGAMWMSASLLSTRPSEKCVCCRADTMCTGPCFSGLFF